MVPAKLMKGEKMPARKKKVEKPKTKKRIQVRYTEASNKPGFITDYYEEIADRLVAKGLVEKVKVSVEKVDSDSPKPEEESQEVSGNNSDIPFA